MKYGDIQKLHEAGLISEEQRSRIVDHFHLKEEGGRFLAIIAMIGAVLIGAGIILLVSANWATIPRGVKIATGLGLMLGAHGAGWWLREGKQTHPKIGEALHLVGSALFLANIALIGQIYNLSSRPPNALLLWVGGIAALPWILRSKAQHILVLIGFSVWFAVEASQPDSWIFGGGEEYATLLYAVLGLIYVGAGYCLSGTRFREFANSTLNFGVLLFQALCYPLTLDIWRHYSGHTPEFNPWLLWGMAAVALPLLARGLLRRTSLSFPIRCLWACALVSALGLLAARLYVAPESNWNLGGHHNPFGWLATGVLFVMALIQIQVGLQERSSFLVNLGIAMVALHIITTYLQLIGSMSRTGTLFVISGVLLMGFGILLEKKRRALMRQIKVVPN
jgi:uncharacterized membrane protein